MEKPFTNALIHETSPYLLQHAHNPVAWLPWNETAWTRARNENKLVLVSVGYSSCHWCHVMEHETFEDPVAAKLMNDNFICIKVDREERPDIDQVYMSAVQLMTGQGGWPLNCICLPNGKPIYGGTYFPNAHWQNLLKQIHEFYQKDPSKAEQYAEELTQGIQQMEIVQPSPSEINFKKEDLKKVVENWKNYFDHVEGGPNRAPKFPLPNNYDFLLHYAVAEKDDALKDYVLLTLDKMAFGGIYDQVGGGFARYSTDAYWKVPTLKKMLYDNAQLVSLYSHAYQLTKKNFIKNVVFETLQFVEREMTSSGGGFYAALDADSEGVEGKFYVWTREELQQILSDKFELFADYYNVNETGYWEHETYILLRKTTDEQFANRHNISIQEISAQMTASRMQLLAQRNLRARPGLDDKLLTSWNALMIIGYCDAYEAFGEEKFLHAAVRAMSMILKNKRKDGALPHVIPKEPETPTAHSFPEKNKPYDTGFLEDYAFVMQALIKLYQVTFTEDYLNDAKEIAEFVIQHFADAETGMFFFTSDHGPQLIARKKEIQDNVIPASNSELAKVFFQLGKYFDLKQYERISQKMLHQVKSEMPRYGSSYSNWCELMMWNTYPFHEIAIAGIDAEGRRKNLTANYFSNKIIAGTSKRNSKLPLLENRFVENKTLIYVCENYACRMPVESPEEALKLLK